MDRRDLAVLLTSSFTELTFGLNKLIPLYNAERSSQLSVMHDVLNIFEIFTDANGCLDEMKGYLSGPGAPFYQPDAVAVCPGRVIKMLSQVGFFHEVFYDTKNATIDLATVENVDEENLEDLEKSMIFYRFRKAGQADRLRKQAKGGKKKKDGDDEEEEEDEGEEESPGGEGEGHEVLVRNFYMSDNYYYNDDLHIQNIISVLLNSTNLKLRDFTKAVTEQVKDLGAITDDAVVPDELEDEVDDDLQGAANETAVHLLSQVRLKTTFELGAIIAAVQEYISARNMPVDRVRIIAAHRVLRGMSNAAAIDFYGIINPGGGGHPVAPAAIRAGRQHAHLQAEPLQPPGREAQPYSPEGPLGRVPVRKVRHGDVHRCGPSVAGDQPVHLLA